MIWSMTLLPSRWNTTLGTIRHKRTITIDGWYRHKVCNAKEQATQTKPSVRTLYIGSDVTSSTGAAPQEAASSTSVIVRKPSKRVRAESESTRRNSKIDSAKLHAAKNICVTSHASRYWASARPDRV